MAQNDKNKLKKNLNPNLEEVGEVSDEEMQAYAAEEEDPGEIEEVVTSFEHKMVVVHCIADHKTNIGGVTYDLKRKKAYKLPDDVATILSNAQKVIKK